MYSYKEDLNLHTYEIHKTFVDKNLDKGIAERRQEFGFDGVNNRDFFKPQVIWQQQYDFKVVFDIFLTLWLLYFWHQTPLMKLLKFDVCQQIISAFIERINPKDNASNIKNLIHFMNDNYFILCTRRGKKYKPFSMYLTRFIFC